MPGKHVAVLMGGWSAEREVSLRSGKACADALEKKGYRVTKIDVGRDIADCAANVEARRCAQRAARPPRRGRHLAGHSGNRRHPVQPFGRARVRDGDAERPRQDSFSRRGRADARRQAGFAHGGREGARAGAALCAQAGQRRVERRGVHRHRGARASAAGIDPRGLGIRRRSCWPSRSSPARS